MAFGLSARLKTCTTSDGPLLPSTPTQLIPSYLIGKRSKSNAIAFMTDLSERLANRVQISSDALNSYVDAVEQAFDADVDYGQAVKSTRLNRLAPAATALPRSCGRSGRLLLARRTEPAFQLA